MFYKNILLQIINEKVSYNNKNLILEAKDLTKNPLFSTILFLFQYDLVDKNSLSVNVNVREELTKGEPIKKIKGMFSKEDLEKITKNEGNNQMIDNEIKNYQNLLDDTETITHDNIFNGKSLFDAENQKNLTFNEFQSTVHSKMSELELKKDFKINSEYKYEDLKNEFVYNKDGLQVYKSTTKRNCIEYVYRVSQKDQRKYSFCISWEKGNLFYRYRYVEREAAIFFVYDSNLPPENPKHLLVIGVRPQYNGSFLFMSTEGDNSNETENKKIEWRKLLELYPKLEPLYTAFTQNLEPISREEINFANMYYKPENIKNDWEYLISSKGITDLQKIISFIDFLLPLELFKDKRLPAQLQHENIYNLDSNYYFLASYIPYIRNDEDIKLVFSKYIVENDLGDDILENKTELKIEEVLKENRIVFNNIFVPYGEKIADYSNRRNLRENVNNVAEDYKKIKNLELKKIFIDTISENRNALEYDEKHLLQDLYLAVLEDDVRIYHYFYNNFAIYDSVAFEYSYDSNRDQKHIKIRDMKDDFVDKIIINKKNLHILDLSVSELKRIIDYFKFYFTTNVKTSDFINYIIELDDESLLEFFKSTVTFEKEYLPIVIDKVSDFVKVIDISAYYEEIFKKGLYDEIFMNNGNFVEALIKDKDLLKDFIKNHLEEYLDLNNMIGYDFFDKIIKKVYSRTKTIDELFQNFYVKFNLTDERFYKSTFFKKNMYEFFKSSMLLNNTFNYKTYRKYYSKVNPKYPIPENLFEIQKEYLLDRYYSYSYNYGILVHAIENINDFLTFTNENKQSQNYIKNIKNVFENFVGSYDRTISYVFFQNSKHIDNLVKILRILKIDKIGELIGKPFTLELLNNRSFIDYSKELDITPEKIVSTLKYNNLSIESTLNIPVNFKTFDYKIDRIKDLKTNYPELYEEIINNKSFLGIYNIKDY